MNALIEFDRTALQERILQVYEKLKLQHPWSYAADRILYNKTNLLRVGQMQLKSEHMMRGTGKTTFGLVEGIAKALIYNETNGRLQKPVRIAIVATDSCGIDLTRTTCVTGNNHTRYLNMSYVSFHPTKTSNDYGIWMYAP